MVEQSIQVSIRCRAGSSVRSPLLMPVVEGNTLRSDDVAVFLKGRLSLMQERTSPPSSVRLS
jgi:hypothetical protein